MSFDHFTSYAGRPVVEAGPQEPAARGPVTWRLSTWHFDENMQVHDPSPEFRDAFDAFVDRHGPEAESLVIGSWGYAAFHPAPIAQLVAAAPRLPRLRALFLGDITGEECEVSWMKVGDVSAVLAAYPGLEVFGARGGEDFTFSPVKHPALRSLTVQSGGLSSDFAQAVLASDLPALTDLELWLGVDEYGGDITVETLAPLLSGTLFPALRRLGLRNAEIADELARALAHAPVVTRLESLDLSLGTLSDEGAEALLAGQPLTHLADLDLHHHYLSEAMQQRVPAALPAVRVDVTEEQEPDEDDDEVYRYTAVSE
jgi:hypothetical protein